MNLGKSSFAMVLKTVLMVQTSPTVRSHQVDKSELNKNFRQRVANSCPPRFSSLPCSSRIAERSNKAKSRAILIARKVLCSQRSEQQRHLVERLDNEVVHIRNISAHVFFFLITSRLVLLPETSSLSKLTMSSS